MPFSVDWGVCISRGQKRYWLQVGDEKADLKTRDVRRNLAADETVDPEELLIVEGKNATERCCGKEVDMVVRTES